ncbi:SDR family NAD(P)-dependent oxidoreductase [Planomonospora alba]|uniref:SDR family NAD(P)-dependent oxidoreductase n=1 Tax=Planomonospora alba TaxID=161354 RepID=A0ABP6P3W0_9ACTN
MDPTDTAPARPLAVVTGASSGIGYELAGQFARNGFDLLVAAEDEEIAPAARALRKLGARVEELRVDLADYDGVERLYGAATAAGRPVEAVAINAGIGVGGDFARETDLRAELRLIDLNVTSAVHLAKRMSRDMAGRGRGRILFTSSVAATMPGPFQAVYSASKAFLLSFAEAIREELKGTGVTVTALMPGPTETEFFERAGMQDTRIGAGPKDDPAEVARAGFEALMAGKDHVVAGSVKNKLMAGAAKVAPEAAKAAAHRRLSEPGSGT